MKLETNLCNILLSFSEKAWNVQKGVHVEYFPQSSTEFTRLLYTLVFFIVTEFDHQIIPIGFDVKFICLNSDETFLVVVYKNNNSLMLGVVDMQFILEKVINIFYHSHIIWSRQLSGIVTYYWFQQ